MEGFRFPGLPTRVVLGHGTLAEVPREMETLGRSRAVVLSTPGQRGQAEALAGLLGERAVGVIAEAVMHTPVAVTEAAVARVRALDADCVIAVGGGSTTGLGKAIALRTDLDQIVVPTTYAGSEMTPILGETRDGAEPGQKVKTTQKSQKILPEVVVYDIDLTLGLPLSLTATSGLNAVAHAVEALYAQDRNPIVSLMAEEAIRALARALPAIAAAPQDRTARADALYGAWLAGACLGTVGMALHHKLCHVLGGSFDLPHAATHAVVLPHAAAYNAPAAPEAMARVARALGAADGPQGLHDLAASLGVPTALKTIGMPEAGLDRAAEAAVANSYWNPRPLEPGAIRRLLDNAFHGRRPDAAV
ncbi:maleylacetate reductase [Methylobacterium aquaticum]|uniref:Maleylacetate reductase n=1 Tax=Methylobacterium aquaticum TaxID=270351 RepID=A0A0J6SQR6_9HYPH|nr:maleylacetate reductase [Methylobacterium aquaticum]KMO35718.1 Maleylacetate reductase [Methylobacterium aquaticum]